jgi:hypothetical protein
MTPSLFDDGEPIGGPIGGIRIIRIQSPAGMTGFGILRFLSSVTVPFVFHDRLLMKKHPQRSRPSSILNAGFSFKKPCAVFGDFIKEP